MVLRLRARESSSLPALFIFPALHAGNHKKPPSRPEQPDAKAVFLCPRIRFVRCPVSAPPIVLKRPIGPIGPIAARERCREDTEDGWLFQGKAPKRVREAEEGGTAAAPGRTYLGCPRTQRAQRKPLVLITNCAVKNFVWSALGRNA